MRRNQHSKKHLFRDKLLLNQWLISLFGINPLKEYKQDGAPVRPFHILAKSIKDESEGLHHDNLHNFYHTLISSSLFGDKSVRLSREQLLVYEENIARHTQAINEKRTRPIVWKYFQWLTLLFTEIYLDRYFNGRDRLQENLNDFVQQFNQNWKEYIDVPEYSEDDLNKLCFQNATGSGKTLLMHVNLLQYRHYAHQTGQDKHLSRVILLTPNERLSSQHIDEFRLSGIRAEAYLSTRGGILGMETGLDRVDVLEITKLADSQGPNTIATRSLGDQNLLFVDEGHRGMNGKEEGAWFSKRTMLCEKGFTFEYSATFEQAVAAADREDFENSYARSVLFDYSYRWFYEDGYGKDYQILNLPQSFDETQAVYLTACLLKFYQQLRICQEHRSDYEPFNVEKPLWVFVGSTVSRAKGSKDEKAVAADVALIIQFFAEFLTDSSAAQRRIGKLLSGTGQDTGLLDSKGNDIFAGAFEYLAKQVTAGKEAGNLYRDILQCLFNNSGGGQLILERIKGESGEVALKVGTAEEPFGLINVGDAKGLCDHVEEIATARNIPLSVEDSDFTDAMFASIRESTSPVNLLIGSKKFVEGWDCWRVSTMGLMHVGRSEGAQIIQLFGRGVRLKGYEWCLKRSGHSHSRQNPPFIQELETLNVFGIEANFMEKFRDFLEEQGLPGNERHRTIIVPLNVTYDVDKRLRILRPKRKSADGREYDFKKDAAAPCVGDIPEYITRNRVIADWYPRIQTIASQDTTDETDKDETQLSEKHVAFLDFDELFFEAERFKQERGWHNLNITKEGIRHLLSKSDWYTLHLPKSHLEPTDFSGIRLLQQVATELLKRYCDRLYNYRKREYMEPRLELQDLTRDNSNFPEEEEYQLIVDANEEQLIQNINQIKVQLEANKEDILPMGDLHTCNFGRHLYQPLFHVRRSGKITVLPVSLNESEYQFVSDLKQWYDENCEAMNDSGTELYLLRNMSRGKGVGFFEAANFHPDFILWLLEGNKQYITFVEPHGLVHEGPGSDKILFHRRIKDVEERIGDPNVILNSVILSWTRYSDLKWDLNEKEIEDRHILLLKNDEKYVQKLLVLTKNRKSGRSSRNPKSQQRNVVEHGESR